MAGCRPALNWKPEIMLGWSFAQANKICWRHMLRSKTY